MGFRSRIKARLIKLKDRFTGEFSAAASASETVVPYEKPGHPMDDVKVTMARLQKPVSSPKDDSSRSG